LGELYKPDGPASGARFPFSLENYGFIAIRTKAMGITHSGARAAQPKPIDEGALQVREPHLDLLELPP
jgi:hypothetical protein